MLNQGATSQPAIVPEKSRLFGLGMGVVCVLFGLWIIRRQVRAAPPFVGFGTSGKILLGFAGVVGLAAVGYGFWANAHHSAGPPARRWLPLRPASPANNGPASAPAPLPPAAPGDEPAPVPGSLPAAVPQDGGPAPAPMPLPPTGE